MRIFGLCPNDFSGGFLLNRLTKFGCVLLVGFFVVGCAGKDYRANRLEASNDKVLIEDVPFYPDDRYWCGPATLTALLNYHGADISIEDVADTIYSESARGTVPFDMVWYAEEAGYEVTEKLGNLSTITQWLRQGHPVIVFVYDGNMFYTANHYMLVVGISEDYVIVNSGETRNKILSRETFRSAWDRKNNWMMVIQ